MTISVDWAAKVIFVEQSDLTFVSGTLYELDIDAFRLALKALEAGGDGMSFLDTHRHNPPVTVSGITLARVVEIINGYTVTFEDGQYAVNLVGANSNIGDVVNRNQVSIGSQNSAGLIDSAAFLSKITEIWQILGLDIDHPMTVTATDRIAGSVVSQTISVVGDAVTVTRSP